MFAYYEQTLSARLTQYFPNRAEGWLASTRVLIKFLFNFTSPPTIRIWFSSLVNNVNQTLLLSFAYAKSTAYNII